jgi:heptosyltransferase-2
LKILIRATNWIGDAIMSLPAIRAIRGQYPAAEITVLAKPWVAALCEGVGSVDRVMTFTGASGARDWRSKRELIGRLRDSGFDLAILFPNSFESAAVVRLAGVKRIVGYARDARGFLLTDSVPVPKEGEIPKHERFYYLELLRRAGLIAVVPQVAEIRRGRISERTIRGE